MSLSKVYRAAFVLLCGVLFFACQTTNHTKDLSLNKLITRKGVIVLKYQESENGLHFISMDYEGNSGFFLLDTGATRSALFEGSNLKVIKHGEAAGTANIFGLAKSGVHTLITNSKLAIGDLKLGHISLAILPERRRSDYQRGDIVPDGILGMDVLSDYKVFIEAETKIVYLIPTDFPDPYLYAGWTPIQLFENPFIETEKKLHFFSLRVGQHLVSAILDTGAEFNAINWNATIIPELKRLRKRLKEDWEVQGAIGDFDPASRVVAHGIKAGRMKWDKHQFLVINFEHLASLGFDDAPLVIAGMPLFRNRSLFLDFENDFVWVKNMPAKEDSE